MDSKGYHKTALYVMCEGKVLRRSEELKNCEDRDGCTVHVVSRVRGGGIHKDKESKAETKQVTRQEPMTGVTQETPKKDEDKMIKLLDENRMKSWVEFWSKGKYDEFGQRMEYWMSSLQERTEVDNERCNIWKCGMRWAVGEGEKRGEKHEQRRQEEQEQNAEQQPGKKVCFGEEEQLEETRVESTDEPEVTGQIGEMITGRGTAGLVRGQKRDV